jgi:hypothetical protein
MFGASPLKSKEEAYKSSCKDHCALEAEAEYLFLEGMVAIWSFTE